MHALPNPFTNSAASDAAADTAAAPQRPPLQTAAAGPDSAPWTASSGAEKAVASVKDSADVAAGPITEPAGTSAPAETTTGADSFPAPVGLSDHTDCIPELLARLNAGHPCDLDALRANKAKIDRNSAPPDRELLTFLQGEAPIYWPDEPRPRFLQALGF